MHLAALSEMAFASHDTQSKFCASGWTCTNSTPTLRRKKKLNSRSRPS
jgi:hypothetical protein